MITPKRGAIPSPRSALAAATPHLMVAPPPPNALTVPGRISFWGNDVNGDCVTAEEAFARACNNPEIFISDNDVIAWATNHGVLNGATLVGVLNSMQKDGFVESSAVYDDGPFFSVDWTSSATLQSAISRGTVKIGVAADQLLSVWQSNGGKTGWFAIGFQPDSNEDHCASLCGYGPMNWLAEELHVQVPQGVDGTKPGYAIFTWDSIGIIDEPSMRAITHEAWLRTPTTVTVPRFPNWQELDNNPDTVALAADGTDLYQLHKTGRIFKYTGTPVTGWQLLDQNPATKQLVVSGGNVYQLHDTGRIFTYTGTPVTGWQLLDQNPDTVAIAADGANLYQLHKTGKIFKYTGTPVTGWQLLDQNPATKQLSAAGSDLFQIHSTGAIWKYVGPPVTGWQELDGNPASVSIVAAGNNLYQLHATGLIWRYTGALTPVF